MLHHTRRWNRDHSDELQSSWMNGTGMVVWDAVFGSWVGWNERDRSTLRRMRRGQHTLADVLLDGEWTPLVDALARSARRRRLHVAIPSRDDDAVDRRQPRHVRLRRAW